MDVCCSFSISPTSEQSVDVEGHEARWAILAQCAKLISGLAATFLLSRFLNAESLAAWFVFVSLFGIASLLELGFGQVVTRHIAYASNGTRDISPSAPALKLIRLVEQTYVRLALLLLTIGVLIGAWMRLGASAPWSLERFGLWLIYLAGGTAFVLSTACASILAGLGAVKDAQRNQAIAAVAHVGALAGVLVLETALLGATISLLLAQSFCLYLNASEVRKWKSRLGYSAGEHGCTKDPSIHRLTAEAALFGMNFIGYQLLTSGFLLLYSRFAEPAAVASYGLTSQLASAVLAIAGAWSVVMVPKLAMHNAAGLPTKVRSTFYLMLTATIAFATVGLAAYAVCGPWILGQFGSRTPLLEMPELLLLCVGMWTELVIVQFAHLLFSQGRHHTSVLPILAAAGCLPLAAIMFYEGYSLALVLAAKAATFAFIVGVPVVLDSYWSLLRGSAPDMKLQNSHV